jgi:hypothetical protein
VSKEKRMISKIGKTMVFHINGKYYRGICKRHSIILDQEILQAYIVRAEDIFPYESEGFILNQIEDNNVYDWYLKPLDPGAVYDDDPVSPAGISCGCQTFRI